MMKLSSRALTAPTRREMVLLCAVVFLHAIAIMLALHATKNASIGRHDATPSMRLPVSVNLRAPLASVSSAPPQAIRKAITDKRARSAPRIDTATNNPSGSTTALKQTDLAKFRANYAPPSAILRYDAQAIRSGKETKGSGRIFWQSSDSTFSIQGEIALEEKNALTFASEGVIDRELGMSPNIYVEKQRDETPSNTHFLWDKKTASFSGSPKNHSLRGGEQDRASIIWQLARMGRQDSKLFAPNTQFALMVVGARHGEAWLIRILEQIDLKTAIGDMNTWHLVLTPPVGSDESKLDLWLAPTQNWYPVKLRYTDANGDTLDLLVQEISLTPDS